MESTDSEVLPTSSAVPQTVKPSTSSKPSRKDKRDSSQAITVKAGVLNFTINPKQLEPVVISLDPTTVAFKRAPEYYDILARVNWTDAAQGVRHSYTAAASPSSGHKATLSRLAKGKEAKDVSPSAMGDAMDK